MSEKTEQQKQLEASINKAGKAFDVLVKEIEKIDTGLTSEQIDIAFHHLATLLELSRQRAHFAQQVSGFSFDTAVDARPAIARVAQRLQREEQPRLVGQGPRKPKVVVDPDAEAFLDEE